MLDSDIITKRKFITHCSLSEYRFQINEQWDVYTILWTMMINESNDTIVIILSCLLNIQQQIHIHIHIIITADYIFTYSFFSNFFLRPSISSDLSHWYECTLYIFDGCAQLIFLILRFFLQLYSITDIVLLHIFMNIISHFWA